MAIATGRTFEIYSVGDGEFMRRILDSVAAMSNSGLLLQLVGFGLMIGLLIMAFRNVVAGGSKLDLGSSLVGVILGFMMFGLKANVVIHDLGLAPGESSTPSYTVSNVPFGIAAAGFLVTGTGYALTEKLEQGFGLYTPGSNKLIDGGFGNSLEWIGALRAWDLPSLNGTGKEAALFRDNLTDYVIECVIPGIEMNHLNYSNIIAAKGNQLWQFGSPTGSGFGYGSHFKMVELQVVPGTRTAMTCHDAFTTVLVVGAATVPDAFADAIAKNDLEKSTGGVDAAQKMSDAFAQIGINTSQMQDLVLASAVGQGFQNALSNRNLSMSMSTQSRMMVEQASAQRAVQWAAEETMFRRIMRPMMAFFESLMFALAPFMAIAVGLGSYGIQIIGKYLMLSIWVVLWLPMLAIIQLYQVTMLQHAVRALNTSLDGGSTGAGYSIVGAEMIQKAAIDWLATGAALASWTPAITMALVWGGAVTASALASRLQGQDTVNEKMAAPDTAATPPAYSPGSRYGYTAAGGQIAVGTESSMPTINVASGLSAGVNASDSYSQTAARAQLMAATEALRNTYGVNRGAGVNTGVTDTGGRQIVDGASATNTDTDAAGRTRTNSGSNDTSQALSAGDQQHAAGGVNFPGMDNLGAGYRITSGASHEAKQAFSVVQQHLANQARTIASGGTISAAEQRALSEAVTKLGKADANFQKALDSGTSWSQSQSTQDTATRMRAMVAGSNDSYGMQQSMPVNVLARKTQHNAAEARAAVQFAGLEKEAAAARKQLEHLGMKGADLDHAANIMALFQGAQKGTDGGRVSQRDADARALAFADVLEGRAGSSVYQSIMSGSVRPGSNQDVVTGAPNYSDTSKSIPKAQGPDPREAQALKGQVGAVIAGDTRAMANLETMAQTSVPATPSNYDSQKIPMPAQGESFDAAGAVRAVAQPQHDDVRAQAARDALPGIRAAFMASYNNASDTFNSDASSRVLGLMSGAGGQYHPPGQSPFDQEVANLKAAHPELGVSVNPATGEKTYDDGLIRAIAAARLSQNNPGGIPDKDLADVQDWLKYGHNQTLLNVYGHESRGNLAIQELENARAAGDTSLMETIKAGNFSGPEKETTPVQSATDGYQLRGTQWSGGILTGSITPGSSSGGR